MKINAVKNISAVVLVLILLFTTMCTTFAKTVQDDVEGWLNGLVEEYNAAESEEEKASLQEQLNSFLEQSGLENMDLSSLTETDIGQIVGGVTDGSALSGLFGLASDAWASGMEMIQDVFSKGSGTSDGSNTATTNAPVVTSPNVIVADTTTAEASTQAVGIVIPSTTAAPVEITTYNVGATTAPAPVGPGITTTMPVTNPVVADSGVKPASVGVFAVLTAATLGIIVVIVVFFVIRRK